MHDAKQSSLSKIKVGDTILAVDVEGATQFEFGRPKDPKAYPTKVTQLFHKPDQWTGKVYTVQITGGRRNEGRYGTTHVYVVEAKPNRTVTPEMDLDLAVSGTKRVIVAEDGTMRVKDWTGGDVTERTPKGRLVHIAADGTLTILEDFPEDSDEADAEERPDEPTERPATDEEAATADRCHACKGYGVVRKRGSKAGKPYRTAAGAEAATENGNSEKCPTCKGATLLVRSA